MLPGVKKTSDIKESSDKATRAASGSFSLPAISTPRGGGAIRGIGEKFSANPVTGTGSLNVPIIVSGGRSGFGPQLSLSYDSGSGNGPFGFGWSLSLPAITRKTDKGLPKYLDTVESDVFLLSGSEDLVPVYIKDNAGNYSRDAKGNLKFDEEPRGDYMVRRYRPRIEGLFAHIERWARNDGDVHWRSISKDNILTVYGRDYRSRIADGSRVFGWLICESYDDRGNAIVYEYKAEDSSGLDLSPASECGRSRTANCYIKRIFYGNRQPLLLDTSITGFRKPHTDLTDLSTIDWMFQVVFDYGEGHYELLSPDNTLPDDEQHQLARAAANPTGSWTGRPDPFSAYRAGFEVRTHRRCQRVLMFHSFPELGSEPYLVRSTEFDYSDLDYSPHATVQSELGHDGSTRFASFIQSVVQSGYVCDIAHPIKKINGVNYLTYIKRSLPALELQYSHVSIKDEVKEISAGSLENMPYGMDGSVYQLADLDGEGLPGILTEQANAWFYKRNLGNGNFGPLERLSIKPSLADLAGGRQQLLDLAGDGQLDVAEFDGPVPGFYERTSDQGWDNFSPFVSLPNVAWKDPNLKFADLTGDGHADIVVTEGEAITMYPSMAEEGFGPSVKVCQAFDEAKGPRLMFNDGTHSIYLADMSGDGLVDLVRIRNGEVCYWPNLGYGHFGPRVTMDNPPLFDEPEQFDQKRIRLADVDGSGTSDIIYLGRAEVKIYFNRSGNSWSDALTLSSLPHIDNLSSIQTADLLGNGTACLVWSSPLPGDSGRPLCYIDLMGGQKPHLLVCTKNNLGAETRVYYAASTKFYLDDKAKGKVWATRLPFPVHVVYRMETYDRISRNRFVTRFAYHHGHYDGVEREFRGFGMVEQWDTEEIDTVGPNVSDNDDTNWDTASFVPPVLTRTWYHTGAYLDESRISRQFEDEYYKESDLSEGVSGLTDAQMDAMLLDDTVLPDTMWLVNWTKVSHSLSIDEAREACRALKGSILRQEVYALDGTDKEDRPYSVSERNYTIEILEPIGSNGHAVIFTCPRETIDFHYERKLFDIAGKKLADPRVSHTMALEVDRFGDVLMSAAIGYGRRYDDPLLTDEDKDKQKRPLVTYTASIYTDHVDEDDAYRTPLLYETRTYELLKVNPDTSQPLVTNLFRFNEMIDKITAASDGLHNIPYEDIDAAGAVDKHPYRRLIEQERTLYRKNNLTGCLLPGELQSLALPYESYKLAFTPGLISRVYGGKVTDVMLTLDCGYIHCEDDDDWWIPSGKTFYSKETTDSDALELAFAQQHFFLPQRLRDPFGNETSITYDGHDLLPLETEDPMHNKVTAGERDAQGNITNMNDYRVLQPALVTDPNGNRSSVAFDALGMVAGMAQMGKPGDNVGDSLDGFLPDLNDADVDIYVLNPMTDPYGMLQKATTRLVYDLSVYYKTRNDPQPSPAIVCTLARETHDKALGPGQQTRIQHTFAYSDGFGREIQKKVQAETEKVGGAPDIPRWVGSGSVTYNNKGNPIRQYEPFFSATHEFEFARAVGVSSTTFYDPVGRVVATLHPDHTFEKVVFDPWRQETWDMNDNILEADPENDLVVGDFYRRLPEAEYKPSWHELRKSGQMGKAEQAAAEKAAGHANTPTVTYFDAMEHAFLTVADNGPGGKYSIRSTLDIEGYQRAVIDALGRTVVKYEYDLAGSHLRQDSMDAGTRRALNDVCSKPVYSWDSLDRRLRQIYDPLHRITHVYVKQGNGVEQLAERTVYGEAHPDSNPLSPETAVPGKLNLRCHVFMHMDGAGVIMNAARNPLTNEDEAYDFKGNLLNTARRLAREYRQDAVWDAVEPFLTSPVMDTASVEGAMAPLLESEVFLNSIAYDAINRPTTLTAQDHSVIRPTYNEAGLLERVDVNLRGAADAAAFVSDIDYNARGQRTLITYGNGVETSYEYDDKTFRLIHLQTAQAAKLFQDLFYTYDPVGHITTIRDDAQQTVYFNGEVVKPDMEYTYDAVYRLTSASGREHIGQASQPQTTWNNRFRVGLAHPNDGQAMRRYFELYELDDAGNLKRFTHNAKGGDWVRTYDYSEASRIAPDEQGNRLTRTGIGSAYENYAYDLNGNMTSMPHLPQMDWDFDNRLQMVDKGGGCKAYYRYDSEGQRVRKVIEQAGSRLKERIYHGGYEVYRKYNSDGSIALERETLHIGDDKRGIALVDSRTKGDDGSPEQLIRYQLSNHLGSACLELDDQAKVITYEEYYPYGSTSYQAVRKDTEVPLKRYRYSGKELDKETGLYYYGARYYAPWLGRWTSCDPIGIEGGLNLFEFVGGNPVHFVDPVGHERKGWSNDQQKFMRYVGKLTKEEARAQGIPSNIHGWVKNEMRRASSHRKLQRAIGTKYMKVLGAEAGSSLRVPFKGQFDVGHKKAHVLGGSNKPQNLRFELASDNRGKGTRERMISESKKLKAKNASAAAKASKATKAEEGAAIVSEATKVEKSAAAVSETAKVEKAAATAAKGGAATRLLGKAAPVARALAKPLAAAGKFIGRAAGPLGLVAAGAELATAKTTGQKVDAGITAVSSALLMSKNPVAMAGGTGLMVGQVLDKTLDVSDYSSAAGAHAYEGLKQIGVNDTVSFVAGGVVSVAAIPLAIPYAAADKAYSGISRLGGWIKSKF